MRDTGLIAFLCGQAWALHAPVLEAGVEIVERRLSGVRLEEPVLAAIVNDRDEKQEKRRAAWAIDGGFTEADEARGYFYQGSVAVVPINGVLAKYASMINGLSQPEGMTTARVAEVIRAAGEDRRAKSVLLDIDSPGGTVAGNADMHEAVLDVQAAGKGIVALAHDMAASGAYFLAVACDAVYLTPQAVVGSIGVYNVIQDTSAIAEKSGVKHYLVTSGKHKGGGYGIPVTPEKLDAHQSNINAMAKVFRDFVGERRELSGEALDSVTTGRVYVGAEAVGVGLADRVIGFGRLIEAMNAQA
jgi:signal peptide peptidase SppA